MQLPFERQHIVSSQPHVTYVLDCKPHRLSDGRFKAHVVIRRLGFPDVIRCFEPEFAPYVSAREAADIAYRLGRFCLEPGLSAARVRLDQPDEMEDDVPL